MKKTAVVFSPKYYEHNPGKDHPESPKRLQAIINELENGELSRSKNWQLVPPAKAHIEDFELVHGREYIKLVEAVCKAGGGFLDLEDTVVSPQSYEVALYAVGGTLKALDLVMNRTFRNAFALVRPPGHHASRFRAGGFCLFNNVSIAAECLLKKYRLQRILILDIDAHHGNGTQETFYETDNILYISLHEDPSSFPGTGFVDEIGEGKGLGYTVNIPLPFGTSDQTYLKAMREIAIPITRQFKPQFMLVSAGFDGHHTDPVGNLSLSASGYKEIYKMIIDLASETCGNRIVAVLEGGYSVKWVGKLAASALAQMCGTSFSTRDRVPRIEKRATILGEKVVKDVKKAQKSYWSLD
jgi:acetoin utilization deacetylase AcuC-like enzyme